MYDVIIEQCTTRGALKALLNVKKAKFLCTGATYRSTT